MDNNIESIFELKRQYFGEIINILLIGADTGIIRRENGQSGFNTDTMILVSINNTTKKVLLISVPRDLWVNQNKINALYTILGENSLTDAFEQVTGQKVDAVIKVDFDQFKWIVDSFGGVNTKIVTSFTDNQFPNNTDTGIKTISFLEGYELMNGERALDYSRSRKGDNGEGSDLKRAKRQHLILIGMLDSIKNINSKFWPIDLDLFYNSIIQQNIHTTLTINDIYYLWDLYKDKNLYDIESFVVDEKYVYHPGLYPNSEYRAWVFIAKEQGFNNLHKDITAKLNKTYQEKTDENSGEQEIINENSGEHEKTD